MTHHHPIRPQKTSPKMMKALSKFKQIEQALTAFRDYAETTYTPLMTRFDKAAPAEQAEMLPQVQQVRATYTQLRSVAKL